MPREREYNGFWSTFLGITLHPVSSFARLENDLRALKKAFTLLAIIIGIYTGILAIFIVKGNHAVAKSVLPLDLEEQYPVQIWYQGPLFLLTTLTTSGFLVIISHFLGGSTEYLLSFSRISFASIIPFFFTTMLVEAVISLGLLTGIIQPETTKAWLTGKGVWFATVYQLIGVIWLVALFVIAVHQTIKRNLLISILIGLATVIVYAIPVMLFIR